MDTTPDGDDVAAHEPDNASGVAGDPGTGATATAHPGTALDTMPEDQYRRGIKAWVTYDWANSAFTTVIITAVFPVYFSSVAGATLPSAARATQVFSLVTAISLVITAIVSPLVGSYSDLVAAKKRILGVVVSIGAIATAALWLVTEGDWVMGLVLFAVGRVAFSTGNVMYDSLLPAVARPGDQDAVSSRGFAFGYLGGGILLAVNVAMVLLLPGDMGPRLAFVSVAIWWAVFSLPILRHVPEPAPTGDGSVGVADTVRQTVGMVRSLARLPDLRQFLIAYLIYNDGINVVIAVAALYGAELGFGTTELLLAVLMVQFIAGPYAILLGKLATQGVARRGLIAGFIVANIVLLPIAGIILGLGGPGELVGRAGPAFEASGDAVGQGSVDLAAGIVAGGETTVLDGELLGRDAAVDALVVSDQVSLDYIGRNVVLDHDIAPAGGTLTVLIDGQPGVDVDGDELLIDRDNDVRRFGEQVTAIVADVGPHTLSLVADGAPVTITGIEVAAPPRDSSLPMIFVVLLAIQAVAAVVALALQKVMTPWAERVDARRGIILALVAYVVIAVWGFRLNTVLEFWALAWLVGVVQGGSQALSRSLYAALVPARREGEYFGLFSILSKFASFISPLVFVVSVSLFESSRPAVLFLSVLFISGIVLLLRVDVARGTQRRATFDDLPDVV